MNAELKYIIKSAAERMGIDITLRRASPNEIVLTESGKIIADDKSGRTYFRFTYRDGDYIAGIPGRDKISANYAYLLHGLIENSGSADIALGMNDYLKKIVLGDCSKLQVQKFHVKFNVPDIPCYSLVVSAPKGSEDDVMNVLESYSSNSLDTPFATKDGIFVFVKFIDTPVETEYQSSGEFANYLQQSLFEELGISVSVGVGTVVKHLSEINTSYQQAFDALKMSRIFNSKGSVHSYKEYVLIKMLEDIPKARLKDYLAILSSEESKQIFGDEDMLNTAEEFLDNSLNVSETARELFMHRNTLIYRLDKIEKATGLNIKSFSDAVTFRVITILNKILN